MRNIIAVNGGDLACPLMPLGHVGLTAVVRLRRRSLIRDIERFDAVFAFDIAIAKTAASILAPHVDATVLPKMVNDAESPQTWAEYRAFRESNPERTVEQEALANRHVFVRMTMYLNDCLMRVVAEEVIHGELALIALPHPLDYMFIKHLMRERPPIHRLALGQAVMLGLDAGHKVSMHKLIDVSPPP